MAAGSAVGDNGGADKVIEIHVQGNTYLSDNAVLADVQTRIGQPFDQAVIDADVQRLTRSGRFRGVRALKQQTPQGIVVTYVVVERPVVAGISFKGNKEYGTADLAKLLPFGVSQALNLFSIEAGRQAILNQYLSNGFPRATVEFDKKAMQDERQIIYRIVEGPRVVVGKIRFRGNKYFSNWSLKGKVEISARWWPFVKGYLDAEQMERDVHTIRNEYISEGFLDARVGRVLEYSSDQKKVTVLFEID